MKPEIKQILGQAIVFIIILIIAYFEFFDDFPTLGILILLISVGVFTVWIINILLAQKKSTSEPKTKSSFDKVFDPIYLIGSGIIGGIFLGIPLGILLVLTFSVVTGESLP